MLVYLIFILFAINLLRNYKKWTIIIMALCTWLMQFQMLGQSLYTFLLLYIFLLFPIKEKFKFKNLKEFPLNIGCIAIVISLFVTNFCVDKEHQHIPIMLYYIVLNYASLFIFWQIFKENPNQTTNTFIKASFWFALFVGIYCTFEGLFRVNPYIEIMNDLGVYDSKLYDEVRFGIKRVQGVFSIYTTVAGVALNILFMAIMVNMKKSTSFTKILIVLCIIMILFSGMRSVILCTAVGLLTFASRKTLSPKKLIPIIMIMIVIGILFETYLSSYLDSFINTDKVQGSTGDMRITQFQMALLGLMQSPIWGNGIGYTFTELIHIYPELRGADSIWMTYMIELGLVGVTAYIIFFIVLLRYTYRLNKRLCFYALGVILSQSIASVTSVPIVYVFIYILVLDNAMRRNLGKKTRLKNPDIANTMK